MPISETVYRCQYCKTYKGDYDACLQHEVDCYHNPKKKKCFSCKYVGCVYDSFVGDQPCCSCHKKSFEQVYEFIADDEMICESWRRKIMTINELFTSAKFEFDTQVEMDNRESLAFFLNEIVEQDDELHVINYGTQAILKYPACDYECIVDSSGRGDFLSHVIYISINK